MADDTPPLKRLLFIYKHIFNLPKYNLLMCSRLFYVLKPEVLKSNIPGTSGVEGIFFLNPGAVEVVNLRFS